MTAIDAFWMLANFFAPAIGVGVVTSVLAKLAWRREFDAARWAPLIGSAVAASAVVLIAGLVLFDHDGRMTTYVAMCAAAALAIGWYARRARA